jgi:hypothetical protein
MPKTKKTKGMDSNHRSTVMGPSGSHGRPTRAGSFDRGESGFIFRVYPVNAERRDRGDQGVDWCLKGL